MTDPSEPPDPRSEWEDPKVWSRMKLNLLSTGVPLERLTATALLTSRYRDLGERVSERDGKYFSIDMVAVKDGTLPEAHDLPARLSLFVECKYIRRPNVLAFAPFPAPESSRSLRGFSVNAFLAVGCEKLPMVRARVGGQAFEALRSSWIPEASATCYKGAVVSEQHDAKDIFRESQYQLAFPLVEAYLADLKAALWLLRSKPAIPPEIEKILSGFVARLAIALHVPIVVTNAPLFVLNDDADLKSIEESTSITDISRQVPFVNYTAMVPAEMSAHINAQKEVDELMAARGADDRLSDSIMFGGMNLYLIPRRYHFVQLKELPKFLETLENQFRRLCVKITEEQDEDSGPLGGQSAFEQLAGSETKD